MPAISEDRITLQRRTHPQYRAVPDDWWKTGKSYSEAIDGECAQSLLEIEFNERADRWERLTRGFSDPASKFLHEDHIAILTKGWSVVPFILKRMETSTADWLWALEKIVGKDKNPAKGITKYSQAVKAWRKWGADKFFNEGKGR